jgi:hypothetical protein
MKSLVLTALMLGVSVGLSAPANAGTRADDQKIEAGIVAIDAASGTLHLSNGMVIDRANILQSAALQHLYETEGAAQLQRKVRSTEIRYIANNAKA